MSEPGRTFEAFYAHELSSLLTYLEVMGSSWAEAEDIASLSMTRLWESWGTVDSPRAWVRTDARYRTLALWRRRRARRAIAERFRAPGGSAETTNSTDPALIVVAAAELSRLLAGLSVRQREVMVLHYDGFSHQEIADMIGVSNTVVRTTLSAARKRISMNETE